MEETKLKHQKIVIIISAIVAIALVILLIIIKVNSPAFKTGPFVITLAGVAIIFIVVILVYRFYNSRNKVTNELKIKDLPPAITIEQARELAKAQIANPLYADYPNGSEKETNELLGKNTKSYVYAYITEGIYSKQKYVIIMNRHFPNETLNVLIDPTDYEIHKVKNNAAFNPLDEPNIKETTIADPLSGRFLTTKEEIREQEHTEKTEKGDI